MPATWLASRVPVPGPLVGGVLAPPGGFRSGPGQQDPASGRETSPSTARPRQLGRSAAMSPSPAGPGHGEPPRHDHSRDESQDVTGLGRLCQPRPREGGPAPTISPSIAVPTSHRRPTRVGRANCARYRAHRGAQPVAAVHAPLAAVARGGRVPEPRVRRLHRRDCTTGSHNHQTTPRQDDGLSATTAEELVLSRQARAGRVPDGRLRLRACRSRVQDQVLKLQQPADLNGGPSP
jgi:hypothetical protein